MAIVKTYIVLDTNILFGDYRLDRAKFVDLCNFAKSINGTVIIPEIVMGELVRQYVELMKSVHSDVSTIKSRLSKFPAIGGQIQIDEILTALSESGDAYEEFLRRRVAEVGCEIHAPAVTNIHHLIGTYLRREKPWKANGEGFCDRVLWETVKELSPLGDIIFLSNDSDFGEGKKGDGMFISEELRAELDELAVVRAYPSIFKFLEAEQPRPHTVNADWLRKHHSYEMLTHEILYALVDSGEAVGEIVNAVYRPVDDVEVETVAIEPTAVYSATLPNAESKRLELQLMAKLFIHAESSESGEVISGGRIHTYNLEISLRVEASCIHDNGDIRLVGLVGLNFEPGSLKVLSSSSTGGL